MKKLISKIVITKNESVSQKIYHPKIYEELIFNKTFLVGGYFIKSINNLDFHHFGELFIAGDRDYKKKNLKQAISTTPVFENLSSYLPVYNTGGFPIIYNKEGVTIARPCFIASDNFKGLKVTEGECFFVDSGTIVMPKDGVTGLPGFIPANASKELYSTCQRLYEKMHVSRNSEFTVEKSVLYVNIYNSSPECQVIDIYYEK